MRRITKTVAVLAAAAVVVVGVSLFSLYEAYQQVPAFYHEALAIDDAAQGPARDAFVAQATALASDLHRQGRWHTLFTAEQINAWLALELTSNYPDLLPLESARPANFAPREGSVPRLPLHERRHVDGSLADARRVLERTERAGPAHSQRRAGALPVPLAKVLDSISHAAHELNLRLEWRRLDGDPVALISFPSAGPGASDHVNLEALELRDGELFVSGTIGPVPSNGIPDEKTPAGSPTAANDQAPDTSPAAVADPDQPLVGAAEKETRQK